MPRRAPSLGVALVVALAALAPLAGCSSGSSENGSGDGRARVLTLYNAGSLARPLRAAADSFARREGLTVEQENAGSLETARKLTELGKIPDVVGLADFEVFPQLLVPEHVSWYARFARNRMVLAYTDRSRHADEMSPARWREILMRPGVEVGRSDPDQDPAGYRALLVMQLAERHYGEPGLAQRLLAAAPPRNVRPKEVDLVALLQAGELDYVWQYESVSRAAGLRWVELPREIDLSSPADSVSYAAAEVRVQGRTRGDTIVMRGAPIVYGISVPRSAPNRALGERFVAWLLSADGRAVLRAEALDALDPAELVGDSVPDVVRDALGRAATAGDSTVERRP